MDKIGFGKPDIDFTANEEAWDILLGGKTASKNRRNNVIEIELSMIDPFPNHPFKVLDNEDMDELVLSIEANGLMEPIVVRKKPDDRYEIISGHRRKYAFEKLERVSIPARVVELNDEDAVIMMVDSNFQRTEKLPSEKAFAYKMRLDAMKKQGKRTDLLDESACGQVDHRLPGDKSRDILAKEVGESAKQVQRYIRLTHLISELLDLCDNRKLSFNAAVEISYVSRENQERIKEYMIASGSKISLDAAKTLKAYDKEGKVFDTALLNEILNPKKDNFYSYTLEFMNPEIEHLLKDFLTTEQKENLIIAALKMFFKANEGK